ncbi:hypothetical protein SAMN05421793_10660 [Epilithonimonas hominis]|uniref:Uncharacterized protein n=1 Tax=Epilithonimonas hominis TaxID=420404 RepID=A0A1H6INJ0_9FLAO|nr:hypothetical protein SAMN05421793_10660 [Epilithonimonas hominis]
MEISLKKSNQLKSIAILMTLGLYCIIFPNINNLILSYINNFISSINANTIYK